MNRILYVLICLLLCGCQQKQPAKVIDDMMPVQQIYVPPESDIILPDFWSKQVSITIGKHCSIKELISKLAETCNANLNMDFIEDKTGIVYTAQNTEFLTIIKEVCRLVGWQVRINDRGDLTIYEDNPYFHTHEVSFLINTNDIGSVSKNAQFKSELEIDLWKELEDNVNFILSNNADHDAVKYSINKQSGMLIVRGTQAQHEQIAHFLRDLHMRVASQVFIEVYILSVELGNNQPNGIDLNILPFFDILGSGNQNQAGAAQVGQGAQQVAQAQAVGVAQQAAGQVGQSTMPKSIVIAKDIISAVRLISKAGPTTIMQNPNLKTRNNIAAYFESKINDIYFLMHADTKNVGYAVTNKKSNIILNGNNQESIQYRSEPKLIQHGVSLIARPLIIDFKRRIVALRLKPSVSWPVRYVEDPIVSVMGGKVKSEHPVLQEHNMEGTITIVDGEVAIVGGMIYEKESAPEMGLSRGRFHAYDLNKYKHEMLFVVTCKVLTPDDMNDVKKLSQYELCGL